MSIVTDPTPSPQLRPRLVRAEELLGHLQSLLSDQITCLRVLTCRTDRQDYTALERFVAECYVEQTPDAEEE